MFRRHRTLAALALIGAVVAAVILGRGAQVSVDAPASVTLDGTPLQPGTREVSPRPSLGLRLPPGSRASDFGATLDGRGIAVRAADGHTAVLEVGDLPQGSHHLLKVWRGAIGPARVGAVDVDFQVADPLQLAASWLVSARQATVQVSASRQLTDEAPVDAALVRAGAAVSHDDRGVEGRWPGGRNPTFTVPAGLRATTGAFLPADFTSTAGPGARLPFSRVDISVPAPPQAGALKLRMYYVPGPQARADLALHARQISVLSPAFYAAAADGSLVRTVDEQALATARAAGLAVEPLVTNQDFNPTAARALFDSGAASDALSAALIAEAERRGFGGYQLDFEGLSFADRDALTRFSQALGDKLRGAGLRYSTAVIPSKQPGSTGLEQIFGHSSVYDYAALQRNTASMSLMAYDQHTSATDPGPVAGRDWVERVLDASDAGLDPSKLYLGVPLYYRDWPLPGTPSAGAYPDALDSAVAHDGSVSWDFTSASPFLRYSAPGEEHVVWFENRTSLAAKLQVARGRGFAGVAAWRLGLEDPGWWDLWT